MLAYAAGVTSQLGDALVQLAKLSEDLTDSGRRQVTAREAGELAGLVVVVATALIEEQADQRGPDRDRALDLTDRTLVVTDGRPEDGQGRPERSTMWTVEPAETQPLDVEPLVRSEVVDLIQKLNRLL